MKKIVIIFLIISLIIPFCSVRTSFSQNVEAPEGWSFSTDYQRIPVMLQNVTYYTYEIEKKEDNNKFVHGWLITDSNNSIVSDESEYGKLALAATVSKYTKKLNESATIERELKDLKSLNWKLKALEMTSATLKGFTSIIGTYLNKKAPTGLIEEFGSVILASILPEDKKLSDKCLQTFTEDAGTNLSNALINAGIVIGDIEEIPELKLLAIFKLAVRRSILTVSRGGVKNLEEADNTLKTNRKAWSYEDASTFLNEYEEGQIKCMAYGSWYIRLLPSASDVIWNDIFKQLLPEFLSDTTDALVKLPGIIKSNPANFGYNEVEKDIKTISSGFDLYRMFSDTSIKDSPASKTYSAIVASLRGTLSISSIPTGAKVYINGWYKGTTPIDIALTSGNYNVKVTKEEYNDYTKDVKVSQGKIAKLSITLVKTSSTGVYYNIGDRVQAIDYLNVRKDPSIKGTVIAVVKKGSVGTIKSACKVADNYHWWIVRWDNGYEGWSAGEYMRLYTKTSEKTISGQPIWPMFHYNRQHTGQCPYDTPENNGILKWKYKTGGRIYSSPAIASDGTIYVEMRKDDYLYYLYALKPNGTLNWKYKVGDETFFITHPPGKGGPFPSIGPPAIAKDGTIYVGSWDLGAGDNYLYALKPNGTLKWRLKTSDIISSSPVIDSDGTIYVGLENGYLYAINPNGMLKWKHNTNDINNIIGGPPAIGSDGTIYVGPGLFSGTAGYLYAINPDGTLKWRYRTGDGISSSSAIAKDGTVYVGSYDHYLYAINPDGTLKWRYKTGSAIYSSSPAISSDGTIYVGSWDLGAGDNYLYALKPNGTLKWKYPTGAEIFSSPAISSDGTIFVGSHDGYLYAINPNGMLKWKFKTGGCVASPAIGRGGTIYVGSDDGYLYAIGGK